MDLRLGEFSRRWLKTSTVTTTAAWLVFSIIITLLQKKNSCKGFVFGKNGISWGGAGGGLLRPYMYIHTYIIFNVKSEFEPIYIKKCGGHSPNVIYATPNTAS